MQSFYSGNASADYYPEGHYPAPFSAPPWSPEEYSVGIGTHTNSVNYPNTEMSGQLATCPTGSVPAGYSGAQQGRVHTTRPGPNPQNQDTQLPPVGPLPGALLLYPGSGWFNHPQYPLVHPQLPLQLLHLRPETSGLAPASLSADETSLSPLSPVSPPTGVHAGPLDNYPSDQRYEQTHIPSNNGCKEKAYKCDWPPQLLPDGRWEHCHQSFTRKYNRNKHIIEVHLRIKDFTCEYCKKGFGRKSSKNTHEKKCSHKFRGRWGGTD